MSFDMVWVEKWVFRMLSREHRHSSSLVRAGSLLTRQVVSARGP